MGEPLVSVLIASVRPSLLARCLVSIHRYTKGIDYQIVIVSPFDIEPHPRVVHVKEVEPKGYYKAVASGYEQAEGEYIIHIADDCRATPLWAANMIAFMKPRNGEIFEGSFRHFDVRGERTEQGHYGKLIAPFICICRDVVPRVGGLMDSYYESFCGDPDLSLRVWHSGGKVETCPNAWIYHCDCDDELYERRFNSYYNRDKEAFIRRWYPIFARPGDAPLGHEQPLGEKPLSTESPPEESTKLYLCIQKGDWNTVRSIVTSNNSDACIYPEGFPLLHKLVVQMLRSPFIPRRHLYSVLEWLSEKGYAPAEATLESEHRLHLYRKISRYFMWFTHRAITTTRAGKLFSKSKTRGD